MQPRERIFVYGTLILLALWNVALVTSGRGVSGSAIAAPLRSLPAAEDLGPAEKVILAGEPANLELRNAEGRLAWGEGEPSRAYSVAFMHIGKALDQMMDAQRFIDEREDLDEEFADRAAELRERFEDWRDRNPGASMEQPPSQQAQQEFRELMEQNQQLERERMTRSGQMLAQQVERAYRDIVAAVEVVADRRGIDIVYRFIPTGNDFQSQTPDQAYMAISARTALRYPERLDITEAIMDELALEAD